VDVADVYGPVLEPHRPGRPAREDQGALDRRPADPDAAEREVGAGAQLFGRRPVGGGVGQDQFQPAAARAGRAGPRQGAFDRLAQAVGELVQVALAVDIGLGLKLGPDDDRDLGDRRDGCADRRRGGADGGDRYEKKCPLARRL